MSLHAQIWSWAQQLKPWQSDMVRRLCASTALTDAEFDEVSRILLAAYDALAARHAYLAAATSGDPDR